MQPQSNFVVLDFLLRRNTQIVNQSGDGIDYFTDTFEALTAASEVDIPQIMKALALYPIDSNHGGDGYYLRNNGERLLYFGGHWRNGARAGVFYVSLFNFRSYSNNYLGFRSAFIDL